MNSAANTLVTLVLTSFLLTACGGYVDTSSGGFVDSSSGSTFERESVSSIPAPVAADEPIVLNEEHEDFVPAPVADIEGPTPVPYEESFRGRGAVDVRVWNDRGFEKLFLPEGATVPLERLGITLEVKMIAASADGDAVVFALDGEQLPSLRAREEVRLGRTYILVRHVYAR